MLISSTLIFTLDAAEASFLEETSPHSSSFEQVVDATGSSRADFGKAGVVKHRITSSELEELKKKIGVSAAGTNHNLKVGVHGTGLRAPTLSEWQQIAASVQVVDSVTYPTAPVTVDNSLFPWFPPIGNQGSEGSCVAWSVGYYVKTFQEAKEHGWDFTGATWGGAYPGYPTVSYEDKIMSPEFLYHLINNGTDNGASFQDAINLVCSIGVSSWQRMPYSQTDHTAWPSEQAWTEAPLYRGNSSGYQYLNLITDSDLESLKNWIASGNLATIGVDANKYSSLSNADLWNTTNYVNPNVNHANTVVGYDDNLDCGADGFGAFKVANSWGKGVGNWEHIADGFYWISYEAMKQRVGATSDAMFYYDLVNYQPELTATFRIDHAKRGEGQITVGVGSTTSPITTKSFTQYIEGGDDPFPSNSMVLDITEFKNHLPSFYNQSYFLRVRDVGSTTLGTITKFAVGNTNSSEVPRQTIQNTNVHVTVTYSLVTPEIAASPTSGPAEAAITLNGFSFTASSSVNISYLNPATSQWTTLINNTATSPSGQFTLSLNAPDLRLSNPAGDNTPLSDSIVFRAIDNFSGLSCNTTVPYSEWRRGLTRVGDKLAAGLFGNNTSLIATVFVTQGQPLVVAGKWFSPGDVTVFWDGAVQVGSATADENGSFTATITVPTTATGMHSIILRNGNADFNVSVMRLPATTDNYDGLWHSSDFTISLTPDASNAETYYRINGGPVKSVSVDGQPQITTESAANTLEYWSVDQSGNEESPHKTLTQIKLDKTAPSGSILINNGAGLAASSSVTLSLTATDATSGVYMVRFSNDGVWDTETWETGTSTKTWTLSVGDGEKTVYYQVRDNAGLIFSLSDSITLDTASPVANAGQNKMVNPGSPITLDAGNSTDNAGIVSYLWDFGDGTNATGKTVTYIYTNSGNYTAILTVRDAAGNTDTSTVTVTVQAQVIPEFPSAITILFVMTIALFAAIFKKTLTSRNAAEKVRL